MEKGNKMNDNFTIFYGEYSLRHWLDLILSKKIILPPYQRRYVWRNSQIEKFVDSIKESFIPPVIIGKYKQDDKSDNADYIIDGQQRLTTLLLLYYGIFPKVLLNKNNEPSQIDEDEDEEEKSDGEFDKTFSKWIMKDFQNCFHKDLSFSDIIKEILKIEEDGQRKYERYETVFFENNKLLETYFLGFSYIHTNAKNQEEHKKQKEFFGRLFEEINTGGKALSILESREALYHIGDYAKYLSLDWLDKKSGILTKGGVGQKDDIDFCRMLALLNDYCKLRKKGWNCVSEKNIHKFGKDASNRKNIYYYIATGYLGKLEEFIKKYVKDINNPNENGNILDIFDDKKFEELKAVILHIIGENNKRKNYNSIIDADYDLFGAVYWTLFIGRDNKYIVDRFEKIQKDLAVDKENVDKKELRNPNQLTRLRRRIGDSIWCYASDEDRKNIENGKL